MIGSVLFDLIVARAPERDASRRTAPAAVEASAPVDPGVVELVPALACSGAPPVDAVEADDPTDAVTAESRSGR